MTESSNTTSTPASAVPTVHIRAVITWLTIFPLVTLGNMLMAPFAVEWNPVLRSFVLTIFVVPVAVYLVVPQLIHAYGHLHAAHTRHRRSLPKKADSTGQRNTLMIEVSRECSWPAGDPGCGSTRVLVCDPVGNGGR